jgi:iron complex transport system permease protein
MTVTPPRIVIRILWTSCLLLAFLLAAVFSGVSVGSSGGGILTVLQVILGKSDPDSTLPAIIWQIRLPRVLLAALVGATLSLGGLVFQALLRNLLAEPYILGISGGSAIGAIAGILLGLSRFPGVSFTAFLGSMATLALILVMTSGQSVMKKESLLLSGVMVNAFCSSVIMFMISVTQDAKLQNIIFWLMGDLSSADLRQVGILAGMLLPCFGIIFWHSHAMNLLLMGKEMAQATGLSIKFVTITVLVTSSFMVSATVSYCGLIGFVGLVMPHLLRLILGPDHRVLVPACILGGGSYLVICDLLARTLPQQGELPAGVITAIIGAPLFIMLLKKSGR